MGEWCRNLRMWLAMRWEHLVAVTVPDEEEARLGRLFNVLMVISIGIVTALSLVFVLMWPLGLLDPPVNLVAAAFPFSFILLSIFCLAQARRGCIQPMIRLYVWINFFAISLAALLFDGIRSPAWLLYIWTITIAGTLIAPRYALWMTLGTVVYYSLLLLLGLGPYTPPLTFGPNGLEFVNIACLIIMLTSTVGLLTYLNMRSLNDALSHLRTTKRELEEHRRTLEQRVADRTRDLAEERNLLRTLIDNLPDYIYIKDTEGRFITTNTACLQILGAMTPPEVIGKTSFDFFPRELAEQEHKNEEEVIGSGKLQINQELSTTDQRGSKRWLSTTKVPLRDSHGKIVGIVGINRDITERKQAEEELRKYREYLEELVEQRTKELHESEEKAEKKYTTIIKTALDGFSINDLKGRFLDVNDSFCQMTGYTREELLAMSLHDIEASDKFEETAQRIQKIIKQGYERFETRYRRKDGKIINIEVSANHSDFEGGVLVVFVRDITERILMQEKLVTSEQLAVLGQFSGSLSHELRNSLATIDSSVYYLRMKLKEPDEKVQTHLERINSGVKSAKAIIQGLLNLTRMKEPRLERLDLRASASEATDADKVPAEVKVVRDFPQQQVAVKADPDQLRMAFKNIVDNAVEAMDGKGTLTVSIRSIVEGKAELSFTDTGPGIPPEHLEKIFQPLFSTKAKGIGFGLSIAKLVAEKNGGNIEAKSELGKGAALIIRLPLCASNGEEG